MLKEIDDSIIINHHFSEGAYAKEILIPAGITLIQHKHPYDHLSILSEGEAILDVDGELINIKAPKCINIKANIHHGVKAKTDCVWFCIQPTNQKNVDEIDSKVLKENMSDIKEIAERLGN